MLTDPPTHTKGSLVIKKTIGSLNSKRNTKILYKYGPGRLSTKYQVPVLTEQGLG